MVCSGRLTAYDRQLLCENRLNLADTFGIFPLPGHEHADVLGGDIHSSCKLGLVHDPVDFLEPFRHLFPPVLGLKQRGNIYNLIDTVKGKLYKTINSIASIGWR